MRFIRTLTAAAACLIACTAFANPDAPHHLTEAQARAIIAPLYKNFNMPQGNVADNIKNGTTSDWQTCTNDTKCRGQDESIKMFSGLSKIMPDMKLEPKEIITSGNKIVVRGELSATPSGEFFGVPHTGKSFKVMTIDIHTIKDGKISYTNHLEDWAGALAQLRSAQEAQK